MDCYDAGVAVLAHSWVFFEVVLFCWFRVCAIAIAGVGWTLEYCVCVAFVWR